MIDPEITKNTLLLGLSFLKQKQFRDGGFSSETAQSINCTNDAMENFEVGTVKGWTEKDDHSFYPALIIALSLFHLREFEDSNSILEGISRFVKEKMCRFGIWQNFTPQHPWFVINPYDIDNTSLASVILEEMGIDFPSNKKALLSLQNKNGLFFTWFTFRWKWNLNPVYWYYVMKEVKNPLKLHVFWKYFECERNDVDLIVNNNLLYYLGDVKETQQIIDSLLNTILENKESSCDKWYLNLQTIYFLISKNYHKGIKKFEPIRFIIRDRILTSFSGDGSVDGNSQDTALAICTLLNLDLTEDIPKSSIQFLINNQKPSGAWKKRLLTYGGRKQIMGWGAEELTTGICLEAIHRYTAGSSDFKNPS